MQISQEKSFCMEGRHINTISIGDVKSEKDSGDVKQMHLNMLKPGLCSRIHSEVAENQSEALSWSDFMT